MKKKLSLLPLLLLFSIMLSSFTLGAQELYLVYLHTNPNRVTLPECDVNALQEGHLNNIQRLYDEGNLILAGPFDEGGGIFVLKTKSYQEALELLKTDPAIAANRYIVETMPLGIQKGMICSQDEPYEMIPFNFIEYRPVDGSEAGIPYLDQMDYAKKEVVVFSAAISQEDDRIGYITILPMEADAESYAREAPVVKKGTHSYEVLKWWSTDKTFCTDENKKIN
ncbi:MAG: YciI family protein [Bacteroidales bacterium]|nr:YciI family protein [Bacteroidales bacterium]